MTSVMTDKLIWRLVSLVALTRTGIGTAECACTYIHHCTELFGRAFSSFLCPGAHMQARFVCLSVCLLQLLKDHEVQVRVSIGF